MGEGTKADDRYDATNIKTMTKDGKVVVGLAKDLTADNVTVGQKVKMVKTVLMAKLV